MYKDASTGFTFSQYLAPYSLDGKAIAYRIAVPPNVVSGQAYDVVLQVVAPRDVGWAGMAWGSGMLGCPLIVSWAYGQSVTITSRWATYVFIRHRMCITTPNIYSLLSYTSSHTLPDAYPGALYEILKTGTRVNGTHWQLTAKCSGCTQFGSKTLNPTQSHTLAMAYSSQAPSNPSSNTSTFSVHTVEKSWNHDFNQGLNPSFNSLVVKNGGTESLVK